MKKTHTLLLALFLCLALIFPCALAEDAYVPGQRTQALIDAVQSAAGAMVQVCAFVVFFLVALRLLTGLTGWSHPALLGFFELTNGILRLPPTRALCGRRRCSAGEVSPSTVRRQPSCVARGSPSARTCAARPCRPPSPPPQPPSPPNGYYKKFSL
mgnify:CR=1 FL=1